MEGNSLEIGLVPFCEWHESFKKGSLVAHTCDAYEQARTDFCNILLMAQRLAIEPPAAQRGALRVAHAYQIELGSSANPVDSIARDISTSGLSALVADPLPMGSVISLRRKISAGSVIVGCGQVVKFVPKRGNTLMALAFEGLPVEAWEAPETMICDVVVNELRPQLRQRHDPKSEPS